MSRMCRQVVELLSRMLEHRDREAVCGDLMESGGSATWACWEIAGLIVRRQAALWKEWKPWLALLGVVGVVGLRLVHIDDYVVTPLLMEFRTFYVYGSHYATGLTGLEETIVLVAYGLAACVWVWAGGFVLASLSRQTIRITGTLYLLLPFGWLPVSMLYLIWRTPVHSVPGFELLTALTGRIALPTVLFLVPGLLGMRQGLRTGKLTLFQASAVCLASLGLTALTTWTGGWPHAAVIRWSGGTWDASPGWEARLFSYGLVNWPALYLIADAARRRQASVRV